MLTMSGSCTHAHWIDLLRKTIWRRSGGGFNGKTSIVGIVSKETGAASMGNLNTMNWDNQTN